MSSELKEEEEEDYEQGLDKDPEQIQTPAEGRKRIEALKEERQRKIDYMRRLEKMLRSLDDDLGKMREQVEMAQRTLEIEKDKPVLEEQSRKREKELKEASQKERVRDLLEDVLYSKSKDNTEYELDTVLISFIKPGNSIRYNLYYRVDSATKIMQLCEDACKYWGVSKDDFILKTMANSKCQNDILVKECFKQGEIAQLQLLRKDTKNCLVSEGERKAIQPKGGKVKAAKRKSGSTEAIDNMQRMSSNYDSKLKELTGVYMLLKLRDMKPSEHFNKIKLRDIIFYTLLAIMTVMAYVSRRPAGQEYWLVQGIEAELIPPRKGIPGFMDITTQEEVWQWLTTTMPYALYSNRSSLRTYNSLQGYVSIRQQSVEYPSENNQKGCATQVIQALGERGSFGSALRFPDCEDATAYESGMYCKNHNTVGATSAYVKIETVMRGAAYQISRANAQKGERIKINFDGPLVLTSNVLMLSAPGTITLTRAGEDGARAYYTNDNRNEFPLGQDLYLVPGRYTLDWNAGNISGCCMMQAWSITIKPLGPECYAKQYDEENAQKDLLTSVKEYYDIPMEDVQGIEVRGPESQQATLPKPYTWYSAEQIETMGKNIAPLRGYSQMYGPSGYSVEFKLRILDVSNGRHIMVDDLNRLKELGWISSRTRMVVTSFNMYNFQYDKWVAADLMFEMPPSGIVRPTYSMRPFKPALEETRTEMSELYIDYVRLIIALYICFSVVPREISHKEKNHKGGREYLFSVIGFADICIVVILIVCVTLRKVNFMKQSTIDIVRQQDTSKVGYVSLSQEAYDFETIAILDGVLFVFNMLRMLSFFRMNLRVYIMWHTVGEAFKMFVYFCCLFIPIMFGFAVLAHSIWGPYLDGFDSLSQTMVSLLGFIKGDLEFSKMGHHDKVWAAVFFILFFLVVTFVLLNIFKAILIDAYYVVQLTASQDPKDFQWNTQKFLTWSCWPLCYSFISEFTRKNGEGGG